MKILASLLMFVVTTAFAHEAFKINGTVTTLDDLRKEMPEVFFEIDTKLYKTVEGQLRQKYLESFWAIEAKKLKMTSEKAREKWMREKASFSEAEVKNIEERVKDHPNFKKDSPKERRAKVIEYLQARAEAQQEEVIFSQGLKSKKAVNLYPKPVEPVYNVAVSSQDHVRFGVKKDKDGRWASVVKPIVCKGDDCDLTVIEYSDYECPFCSRVLTSVQSLLSDAKYRGKVRWIVRDLPLGFHQRAIPAAVAAKCASYQGAEKFWDMYTILFQNQNSLGDSHLKSYAEKIKLNMSQYTACVGAPDKAKKSIEDNRLAASKMGITGTPAFFINGRKLTGAQPVEKFREVFDEELANKSKKS